MDFSDLWPQWLGGTSGLSGGLGNLAGAASSAAGGDPSAINQAAWAMNPALSGIPETAQSLGASSGLGGGAAGGASSDQLSKALQTLGGGGSKSGSSQGTQGYGSQLTSSSAKPASQPTALSELVAELMKRQQSYMPGGSGSGGSGLLGVR